ncbi:baseplate J/gp47 family protein [Massilia sp. H-1]|nr:baseplate J/gp47 family protein [Massilia sp. H-1]
MNDIEWHEADTLALGLAPQDRKFITRTSDEGKTSIIFGNGIAGARLPGGQENVSAVYRSGIGKPGNVKAEQISLLATRPLGAKSVINPLRASGGANAETRDQARKNAPLAVMALDRLVSVQDHADFARTFGGVGKAVAAERSDGRQARWCT